MDKGDHPMNLQDKFTELKPRHESALIAHICAGDPTPDDTAAIVHALVHGGADIAELGQSSRRMLSRM